MREHLWICISEITSHWISLVTGSVVSLVILVWEKKTDRPVKWRTLLYIFFVGFLISLFLAWQDEYTSAEWRGNRVIELSAANFQLRTQLAQKERPIIIQPDQSLNKDRERLRNGLATLVRLGINIRDRAPVAGDAPPEVRADWEKWTNRVQAYLATNFDQAEVEKFKSWNVGSYVPLHFVIRDEIGDLEALGDQLHP